MGTRANLVYVAAGWVAVSASLLCLRVCDAQVPFVYVEDELAWRETKLAELQEIAPRWHFRLDAEGLSRGSGTHEAVYGPSVTQTDFSRIIGHLKFSAEQKAAAAEIYRQRLMNFMEKARPLLSAGAELTAVMVRLLQGSGGLEPAPFIRFDDAARAVSAEQRAMRKGVMEDLKSLLLADQEPLWPRAEQELRRVRFMRSASVSLSEGIDIDVRALVTEAMERMGASSPPAAAAARILEILDAYDLEVDAIFQRACRVEDDAVAVMLAKPDSPERSAAQSNSHFTMLGLIEEFRKVNDRTIRQIAGLLGEDAGPKLLADFNRKAFGGVYRETHAERVLSAAMKLSDLDEEQRRRLAELQTSQLATMSELRGRRVNQIVAKAEVQVGLLSDDPVTSRAAIERAFEVEKVPHLGLELLKADLAIVKKVRALLSPEQRAKLPKRVMLDLPGVETPGDD